MPDSNEGNTYSTSIMESLGMTRIDGVLKWDKNPMTTGSAGRLPLPLPKSLEDQLKNKAAEQAAEKIAAAAKERQDKQSALDQGFEPSGSFSPTFEEAGLVPPVMIPVGGLDENPGSRVGELQADWQQQLWPGVEQIVIRNLRISAFTSTWKDILPLFQAQYAEYLVNPIVVPAPVESTALQISPRSVSGRVPVLDVTDLAYTPEELSIARQLPQRFLEYHLEAAATLLEKARQFQVERENKAAVAASFAMETVQFLMEDQRQRTDIASGVTVAPLIAAMGEWSSSERESRAMALQSQLLSAVSVPLLHVPSESAVAAARLAYATSWMQTVNYGPDITSLSNGTRSRSTEIKDAAQEATQISSVQQGVLLNGQADDLKLRAKGAAMKAASERERAAAAAHSAHRSIQRVNDLANITISKLLMACTPGGALNYAQHEQRVRLEYLATLRAGLLRLAVSAQGLHSMLGYNVKIPSIVTRVLPPDAIDAALVQPAAAGGDGHPEEILLNASLWLRDATTWFLTKMRLERRWVCIVRVRQLIPNDAWATAMNSGELGFDIDAGKLNSGARPRLRGVAIEVLPSDGVSPERASDYFAAKVSFPRTTTPAPTEQIDDRQIGRIRRVNGNLMPPTPELTDCILNVSPLGRWKINLNSGTALDDVLLHLWLAEI